MRQPWVPCKTSFLLNPRENSTADNAMFEIANVGQGTNSAKIDPVKHKDILQKTLFPHELMPEFLLFCKIMNFFQWNFYGP